MKLVLIFLVVIGFLVGGYFSYSLFSPNPIIIESNMMSICMNDAGCPEGKQCLSVKTGCAGEKSYSTCIVKQCIAKPANILFSPSIKK